MVRHKEHVETEPQHEPLHESLHEASHLPATFGDLVPGMIGSINGVDLRVIPAGYIGAAIVAFVRDQFARTIRAQTFGIRPKEEPEEFEAAKARGLELAQKAFAAGLVPTQTPDLDDEILRVAIEAVNEEKNTKARKHMAKSGASFKEAEAAWFAARMTEEEAATANKPLSRSRAKCIRRLAKAWLAYPNLPEKSAKIRESVIAKGQKFYEEKLAIERGKLAKAAKTLFDPLNVAEPEPVVATVSFDDDDDGVDLF